MMHAMSNFGISRTIHWLESETENSFDCDRLTTDNKLQASSCNRSRAESYSNVKKMNLRIKWLCFELSVLFFGSSSTAAGVAIVDIVPWSCYLVTKACILRSLDASSF